jgi:hypothetical protein
LRPEPFFASSESLLVLTPRPRRYPNTDQFPLLDGSSFKQAMLGLRPVPLSVGDGNQILQHKASISALDAAILRLREIDDKACSSAISRLLDACLSILGTNVASAA